MAGMFGPVFIHRSIRTYFHIIPFLCIDFVLVFNAKAVGLETQAKPGPISQLEV
jgi:hypothetical protein